MKVNRNITIELSENELKKLVVEHLKKEGYDVKVENINFSVGSKIEGDDYLSEHQVLYFKGCTVSYQEK